MDERIRTLEGDVRRLRRWVAILAAGLALVVGSAFLPGAGQEEGVVRARGLVITDSLGRERILIGAPIPIAANRVRTDEERVREVWATRYPDPDYYMGFYRDYRHHTNGVLILDENGFDKLALGDPVPDPNIGRRIAPSTGIAVNDAQGFERTGYGVLDLGERYRVVLGLDGERGEGVVLYLDDAGRRGLAVLDGSQSARLGHIAGDSLQNCLGLRLLDGDRIVREMSLSECE